MKRTIVSLTLALLLVAGADAAPKAGKDGTVKLNLYGAEMQVRFDAAKRVKVKKGTKEEVAKCMAWIDAATQETLDDCQRQKQQKELCDWAYVKMLDRLSQTALGQSNEATVLMYALLSKSGYDVRLACEQKKVHLLYQTEAYVYGRQFFKLDGKTYYLYGDTIPGESKLQYQDLKNGGRAVDFRQYQPVKAVQLTEPRTLTSRKNPDFSFTVQVNKNLLDFYADLPSFSYGDNFMTRWTIMADRPLEQHLQETLVRQMKQKLAGKRQLEQVNELLWWVQGNLYTPENKDENCFLFRYDDEVWGYDRALYSEETLFYPYCDTEDRSILLSRLIRDVVGLDVVFIYYPGHTAIGVCITDEDVKGNYVVKDGRHYVICDPTYIGADAGEEMPPMTGKEKTVELLKR
ncbi:MAG: hypothetical protein IJ155_03675 [Prevotella sp.]|nr:hypothetical protein [Prevotella sp.]